jgi:hypothetical protein
MASRFISWSPFSSRGQACGKCIPVVVAEIMQKSLVSVNAATFREIEEEVLILLTVRAKLRIISA